MELETAVQRLSSFCECKEKPQNQKISLLKKAVSFFTRSHFEKLQNEKIHEAVEVIRKYYPLIEKLKDGTEKERSLAAFTLKTIQKYNKRVECQRHISFAKKAADFMFKKLGIEKEPRERKITLPFCATFTNPMDAAREPSFFISKITPQAEDATKLEEDMFRMKAIMLLKKHDLSVKMIDTIPSNLLPKATADTNIVSFSQLLQPLPGEEIELTGQFKRSSSALKRSIPLIETFRLQSKSHQTGFPHPMQLGGFALSSALFPSCPLRPEKLPNFYNTHRKKEEAAIALLPKGRFNESAKQTLFLKTQVFNKKKGEFIGLHRKLSSAFIKFNDTPLEAEGVLSPFFSKAQLEQDPYFYISSAYETFNTLFIKETKQHLYETYIANPSYSKDKLTKTYSEYIEGKRAELRLLDSEPGDKIAYIHLLSSIFEGNILALFLQEMSEITLFSPPLLRETDRAIQASLFFQQNAFLDELTAPPHNEEEAENVMKRALLSDILHFSKGSLEKNAHLLDELECYYLYRQEAREKALRKGLVARDSPL